MAPVSKSCLDTLMQLKEKIRLSRQNAAPAVNQELLAIYLEIGNAILKQQKERGWGKKIITQFAMVLPMFSIWQPPVAKLKQEHHSHQSKSGTKP